MKCIRLTDHKIKSLTIFSLISFSKKDDKI